MAWSLFLCILDAVILIPPGHRGERLRPLRALPASQSDENPALDSSGKRNSSSRSRQLRHSRHGRCLSAQPGRQAGSRGLAVLPPLFIKGMTAKIHLKMKKVPANPFCETVID